jgi:multidrug efflux pump subunit AcrA (membrane-fusion protein)
MIKKIAIILSLAILFVVLGCQPPGSRAENTPVNSQGLKVTVLDLTKSPIENRLTLTSMIEPWEMVMVFGKVPGKLVEKSVREGQRVAKDDLIALINRDEIGAEVNNYPVKSPIAGIVSKISVDVGATVAPSVPIATVVNMDLVKTSVNVIESEIGGVHAGLSAEVTVPAYPDRKFPGTITNVLPTVDPLSHTGKVEVQIKNFDNKLKPGMSATVELRLGRHDNAVAIPKDAIIEKLGEKYVFLYVNGIARKSNIETGYDNGTEVEITKGVAAGDRLVTSDLNVLADGTKIQVREGK